MTYIVRCTVYTRGRQPFVVDGPNNGNIINFFVEGHQLAFFSRFFFDDLFLLLTI